MIVFYFGGCRIELGFPFLAVCSILCMLSPASRTALFASAVHEAGHILCLNHIKKAPECLSFHAFGIDMKVKDVSESYQKSAAVALAGPLFNLCFVPVWFLGEPFHGFALANAALFLLHILPVYPLDGGSALYDLFAIRYPEEKAEKLVKIVSVLFLLPVSAAGFYVLLVSRYNFSLLLLSFYLMFLLLFKR